MAADSEFTPVVNKLGCLRGVSTLTAFGLAVEIGDWKRLDGLRIGAYLGMVTTEYSSVGSRSQGGITKTGNGHACRLLIEAACATASLTDRRARRCVAGGNKHRLPHGSAAMKATGGSTTVGWRSWPGTRSQWSPTRRSSANSLVGAGRWPPSRSNTSSYPRCPTSEPWWRQRLGTTRDTPYEQPLTLLMVTLVF